MQKKLIALAIAGLASGAAFAQSNVTIYGVADASADIVSATGGTNSAANVTPIGLATRNRIESNSSNIGFKGTEALGNGLTASFQIEQTVRMDNGVAAGSATTNTGFANRDTFVGIGGNWGTVRLGYMSTPYRSMAASYDVTPGASGAGGNQGMIGRINTGASVSSTNGLTANTIGGTGNNLNTIGRSQGVAYLSPVFAGFSGSVFYSTNEAKANDSTVATGNTTTGQVDPHTWSGQIGYSNGPFNIGFAHTVAQDTAVGTATGIQTTSMGSKVISNLLGVGYTFNGKTTLNAMYNTNDLKLDDGIAAAAAGYVNNIKNSVWFFGVKHIEGMHEFAGSYMVANDGSLTTSVGTAVNTNTAQDRGANMYMLRYGYNLSKRTQVYGTYARLNNKTNGSYDFQPGSGVAQQQQTAVAGVQAGADPQAFNVGIRHSF
jgi:predicted porin